jgi:hypothetical protein
LEHRAGNPVFVKNLTAIETSTIVKLLLKFQWERRGLEEEEEEEDWSILLNTMVQPLLKHLTLSWSRAFFLLWNFKIRRSVHKILILAPILSHFNRVLRTLFILI